MQQAGNSDLTPQANANSVKELVLTSLLVSARDVVGGMSYVGSLRDDLGANELEELVEKNKKLLRVMSSKEKLGAPVRREIGSAVARTGLDIGMTVTGFDPALSVEAAWRVLEVERKIRSKICLPMQILLVCTYHY